MIYLLNNEIFIVEDFDKDYWDSSQLFKLLLIVKRFYMFRNILRGS